MPSRRNRELPALIAKEHPDRLTGPAALGGRRQVESVTDAEDHVAPRPRGTGVGTARHASAAGPLQPREDGSFTDRPVTVAGLNPADYGCRR